MSKGMSDEEKIHTKVHFDFGGYYSEVNEWIGKNSLYAISFKTSSLEKITYSMLVDQIMKKVAVDEASVKLKLSYNLSKVRRETYIVDDEDVFIFLTESDEESRIPVLHVEELNGIGVERRVEISVLERRSSVGVNVREDDVLNEVCEMVHDGYENDVNDCENVVDKIPCVHAMAAARHLARKEGRNANTTIYELCSVYYLIESWALAYYRTLYVVPHESDWVLPTHIKELVAFPPEYTPKGPGRNQDKRFPSAGEAPKRRKSQPGINLEA
ncbi:unnamed protein product [Arabidopsis thaliana]|uniref:(thale cress) hypothetical protein n=1 Tax=Arabidopsis thaliana TaxID=3702 RepID=A0A7G2FHP2_ARATH|nr:unnamed protein product [Arabidopsis thaliana]